MSKFLSGLDILCSDDSDGLWILGSPLIYESDLLKVTVKIPDGFVTDLASIPRMPFLYFYWGGRAHREAVVHDYLYRKDSTPIATFREANAVFLEAMASRGKSFAIRWTMWAGVWIGGWFQYHRKNVAWVPGGTTRKEIAEAPSTVQEPPDIQTPQEKLNEIH